MLSSKSFYSTINGLVLVQIFSMEPRVQGLIENKNKEAGCQFHLKNFYCCYYYFIKEKAQILEILSIRRFL